MTVPELPPDVVAFVRETVLTVDEVEVMTAIRDTPERWWDPQAMYAALGIPAPTARSILDRLATLNLLDIRITDEVRYRYHPGTRELAETIAHLVTSYRSNRAALAAILARPGGRGVRDFADAFRLRNDDGR
jgi:hypothetical protein